MKFTKAAEIDKIDIGQMKEFCAKPHGSVESDINGHVWTVAGVNVS